MARAASTYRGARRNAWRAAKPRGVWAGYPAKVIEQPPVRENRSRHHDKPRRAQ